MRATSAALRAPADPSAEALADGPVVCISHGFQTNYERGFCNGLAAQGVAVTLISSDRSDTAGLHPRVRSLNLRGSQEEDRSRWRKAGNMLHYHARLMLRALVDRGATWHVMGLLVPLVWAGLVEGLWFRLVCRRYVLTVHDILPHEQHNVRARRLCGWAYRLPHRLVVHTDLMRRRLIDEFALPAGRIVVMEHGIEPRAAAAPSAAPVPEDAVPLLLAFGIVVPRKGTDVLLRAIEGLSFPFRLVIAGPCPDPAFRATLRALIDAHPKRDCIDWRDRFVAESEMETLFTAAAVALLPYRYIDQSGVLFQALRFGTPVVATRVGQFERYVGAEVGELADAGDAVSLQQALERWAGRRQQLVRQSIADFGRTFEWPSTVLALRPAYT